MYTAEQKLKSEAFGAWPGLLITPFARGWAGPFLSHPLVWYRAVSPEGEEALSPFLCGDRPWRGGFCCHWTEAARTGSEPLCLKQLCGGGGLGGQA